MMKSYRKELFFSIRARRGFVNITSQVEACLRESGIREGLCLVNPMHITASVFVNDDESGLHHDYEQWLEKLAPQEPVSQYRHNDTGEDNADSHLKRRSVKIIGESPSCTWSSMGIGAQRNTGRTSRCIRVHGSRSKRILCVRAIQPWSMA